MIASDTIGYLFGYAAITNTRSLALLGDRDANAYEILFSFSSAEEKNQFLNLIRSNEELGNGYVENDLIQPTREEIERARPLARVLPRDVMAQAALIAATLCKGISNQPNKLVSAVARADRGPHQRQAATLALGVIAGNARGNCRLNPNAIS